jgi:hypothetical protein
MILWGRTSGSEPYCTEGRRAGLPGGSNSGPHRHTATRPANAGVRAVASLSGLLKVRRRSATSMVRRFGPQLRRTRTATVRCSRLPATPFRFLAHPSDASGQK